jgi:hypothetical protein
VGGHDSTATFCSGEEVVVVVAKLGGRNRDDRLEVVVNLQTHRALGKDCVWWRKGSLRSGEYEYVCG